MNDYTLYAASNSYLQLCGYCITGSSIRMDIIEATSNHLESTLAGLYHGLWKLATLHRRKGNHCHMPYARASLRLDFTLVIITDTKEVKELIESKVEDKESAIGVIVMAIRKILKEVDEWRIEVDERRSKRETLMDRPHC